MAQNAMDAGKIISTSKNSTRVAIKTGSYDINPNRPWFYKTLELFLKTNSKINAEGQRTILRYMSHLPKQIHDNFSPEKVIQSFDYVLGQTFSFPVVMNHWLGEVINCFLL